MGDTPTTIWKFALLVLVLLILVVLVLVVLGLIIYNIVLLFKKDPLKSLVNRNCPKDCSNKCPSGLLNECLNPCINMCETTKEDIASNCSSLKGEELDNCIRNISVRNRYQ